MTETGYFIVEKGEPYDIGARINIAAAEILIGRSSDTTTSDISFSNYLISRRHCRLKQEHGQAVLTDLGSKHGTSLNGKPMVAHAEHVLHNGDRIGIAMGMAVLRYWQDVGHEDTMEISQTGVLPLAGGGPLLLDLHKKECWLEGQLVTLSGKEWTLLELLYRQQQELVTYDAIKLAVWPERYNEAMQSVDVGMEEVNALVYRVRRKLGQYGDALRTVRAMGCLWEWPEDNGRSSE